MKWRDWMPSSSLFECWVLSQLLHSPLSLSSRLFSFSVSAIRVVSSAYLRLLIFLLAILVPACASSRAAFLMRHCAYKLNKQGDNIQPWSTPFPIWNQSVVTGPVLTVASWPAYRLLRRQVRWSGISISLRIFHSLLWFTSQRLWHSQLSRSGYFSGTLLLSWWSNDAGNLISGSSVFYKSLCLISKNLISF